MPVYIFTCKVIGQPLYAVAMLSDIHDGHSRDLAQSPLQITITRGHNVAAMLCTHHNTRMVMVVTVKRSSYKNVSS